MVDSNVAEIHGNRLELMVFVVVTGMVFVVGPSIKTGKSAQLTSDTERDSSINQRVSVFGQW